MIGPVYTALCDEFGCLWQASSYDEDQACDWANEHEDTGHITYVIGERA